MKFGGIVNNDINETWESLLLSSNSDFISVLLLWYNGIFPCSTYAWMFSHSIEKYLKSYLLKNNFITHKELNRIGKNGHGIIEIWDKFKCSTSTTTSKPKLNIAFDELIIELATIEPRIRYTGPIEYSSENLLYFYIVLCSYIRYLIIGKEKYRSSFYGLENYYFLHMNYNPMSIGYGKQIIEKMLHLSLEHASAFTNMGFINALPIDEYSISNTALFFKDQDCPICNNNKKINQEIVIKYYRDIKPLKIKNNSPLSWFRKKA
jgi:hypothetical protein